MRRRFLSGKAWATVWRYRATFLNGPLNTLESAVVGLGIALIIGFALGLMATSGKRALRVMARVRRVSSRTRR
ncbi:MAG: hypothetical protein V8Q79_09900 [Christensenellales bacterium]